MSNRIDVGHASSLRPRGRSIRPVGRAQRIVCLLLAGVIGQGLAARAAHAQSCEIPVIVSSSVKPNVLIAHDTSGSMKQDFADTSTPYSFNNGYATVQTYEARSGSGYPDYKGMLETYLASQNISTNIMKKHLSDLLGSAGIGFTDAAIYDYAENKVCNDFQSGNCLLGLSTAAKCNLGMYQNGSAAQKLTCEDTVGSSNTASIPKYNHSGNSQVSGEPNPNHCYDHGKGIAEPDMTASEGRYVESGNPCNIIPHVSGTSGAGNTSSTRYLYQGRYLNYQHLAKNRDDVMRQALRDAVAATQTQLNWGLMSFVTAISRSSPGNGSLGGRLVSAINGGDSVTSATGVMNALMNYSGTIGWNSSLTTSSPSFTVGSGDIINDPYQTFLADTLRDAWKYYKGTFSNPGGGSTFSSPITYACQPNFVILATDGRPNTDMREASDNTSNGTDKITSYCSQDWSDTRMWGSDTDDAAVNDFAACVNRELDASTAFSGRQALSIYTIGFMNDVSSVQDLLEKTASAGGGDSYFATNESEFIQAISSAAQSIIEKAASATSAAVVSTTGVGTDTLVTASFQSGTWQGQLYGYALPYVSGANPIWRAGNLLAARDPSTRRIYTAIDGGDADTRIDDRIDFTVANEATLRSYLGAADSTEGSNLINWARGTDVSGYRTRTVVTSNQVWKLGDIVDSNPVVVGTPPFFYPQSSYQTFYTTYQSRPTVIYVAANDGMLHAFDSVTGSERWAFVPNWNLPIFKSTLSSPGYCHYFSFDGTPRVVDAYFGVDGAAASWHTVLIAGGGKHGGYVALDVTDPGPEANPNPPVVLWQWPNPTSFAVPGTLSEARLGAAQARPAIHFLNASGATFPTTTSSWAATIASGANNSDGQAYLFNVALDTGLANATVINVDPANETGNGLSDPAIIDIGGDQATDRVYVGDRLGRMWRWDVGQATNPTQLVYSAGSTRPIMARPILSFYSQTTNDPNVLVYFGTGKLETISDITDLSVQRIYGIKDTGARNGTPSTALVVDGSLTNATDSTTGTSSTSFSGSGWYVDLKLNTTTGEPGSGNTAAGARAIYSGVLVNGMLFITAFTPTNNVCDFGGTPTLLVFNSGTGSAPGSPVLDITGDGAVDSSDTRSGQPARAINLGAGVPSQPVMDTERKTLIVQTSDTLLHPVVIDTGGSPVSADRWKILNR